jgi:hypothetical protein
MKTVGRQRFFFTNCIPDEFIAAAATSKFITSSASYDVTEGFIYELFVRFHSNSCVSDLSLELRKDAFAKVVFAVTRVNFDRVRLWSRAFGLRRRVRSSKLSPAKYFAAGYAFACELPMKLNSGKKGGRKPTLKGLLEYQTPERIASALLRHHPHALIAASQKNGKTDNLLKRHFKSKYAQTARSVTTWLDKYCISKAAYAALRKLGCLKFLLPSPKAVRLERDRLEEIGPQSSLHTVNVLGTVHSFVMTDVSAKITEAAQFFYSTDQLQTKKERVLNVKLSGDGFLMRRKGWTFLHFTIVDVAHPHSADANWVLSMAKCAEKSEVLRAMCSESQRKLLEMKTAGVKLLGSEQQFRLEFFLSADQKFLAIILGLKGPTNTCFCPWCTITKQQSQNGTSIGTPRTMENLRQHRSAGQECLPMLTLMEMDRIVPDILHLSMRCMEKLVLVLYLDVKKGNSDLKDANSASSQYLLELRRILQMEDFVFYSAKDPDYLKKPNFSGQQCETILQNLDKLLFYRLEEDEPRRETKRNAVLKHQKIFSALNQNKSFDASEIATLEKDIDDWKNNWIGRFHMSWINSCHVISQHVPFYLRKYGNIYRFSQQGVEATVKTVKQNASGGILGSANVALKYMCREGRRVATLRDRTEHWKVVLCPSCGKEGHVRKSHKDCAYYQS